MPLKKFFNTSGLLYKSLELKDKLPTMTEEDQLALLATDGMLVKRPILVADDFVLVGFRGVVRAAVKSAQLQGKEMDRTDWRDSIGGPPVCLC